MSNSNQFVWIDDDSVRKSTAADIGAHFIDVNVANGNIEDILTEFFKSDEPKLVILDHYLNDTASESRMFFRGSTIAEALKEQWPTCPVVGITNGDLESINDRTRHAYDEFLAFPYFSQHLNLIEVIADGFDQIEQKAPKTSKDFVELLVPPKQEIDRLRDALPELLKKESVDSGTSSVFYSWVQHIRARAGFLYDSLWAATLIGLNEQGFSKVKARFEKASYRGVFHQEKCERWWQTLLVNFLYANVEPESGKFTWEVGRNLDGLDEDDFSRCYKCNLEYPETVAYLDAESKDRKAMHLECTVLHPGFKRELYFDDVRMMDGE